MQREIWNCIEKYSHLFGSLRKSPAGHKNRERFSHHLLQGIPPTLPADLRIEFEERFANSQRIGTRALREMMVRELLSIYATNTGGDKPIQAARGNGYETEVQALVRASLAWAQAGPPAPGLIAKHGYLARQEAEASVEEIWDALRDENGVHLFDDGCDTSSPQGPSP